MARRTRHEGFQIMDLRLRYKLTLVTGPTKGIGLAIVDTIVQ